VLFAGLAGESLNSFTSGQGLGPGISREAGPEMARAIEAVCAANTGGC